MTEFKQAARKIFKVSELAHVLNQSLESQFGEIWVQGEITNFVKHKSGHFFFALKDADAKLSATMFKFQTLYLRFKPEDGLEVIVRGQLSFYEPRGELRILVDAMEPVGVGALQLAFEQLRRQLEKEGLFALERKRPLPVFCRRIAIVTSPTGAVFHDMMRVFREKDTSIQVLLIPSRVQGDGAEKELANALRLANLPQIAAPRSAPPLDAVILARGGGSIEDLWPFNTELLARAIARSKIPVISAVGHEVDYTVSDMVADVRALTPTAAAEMLAESQEGILRRLESAEEAMRDIILTDLRFNKEVVRKFLHLSVRIHSELESIEKDVELKRSHLINSIEDVFRDRKDEWLGLSQQLARESPVSWLRQNREALYRIETGLNFSMNSGINENRGKLLHSAGKLSALSPLDTLARGYSVAVTSRGEKVVKSEKAVELGALLEVILSEGELEVRVENKKQKNRWEDFNKLPHEDD